jgi:hypothetical protein
MNLHKRTKQEILETINSLKEQWLNLSHLKVQKVQHEHGKEETIVHGFGLREVIFFEGGIVGKELRREVFDHVGCL